MRRKHWIVSIIDFVELPGSHIIGNARTFFIFLILVTPLCIDNKSVITTRASIPFYAHYLLEEDAEKEGHGLRHRKLLHRKAIFGAYVK